MLSGGWVETPDLHCIWKKQPDSPAEIGQALAVLEAQEFGCHRYGGHDPAILKRISPAFCDHPLPKGDVAAAFDFAEKRV